MKNFAIMIKPASSLCNLRCKYCFYKDISDLRQVSSYGIMQEETVTEMLEHIYSCLKSGDGLTFAFQGGEPVMAGLDFYRSFVEQVRRQKRGVSVTYALQTNGTLLNEEWCRFFRENHFLIGISFDILQEVHDETRVDEEGRGTYRKVLEVIGMLEQHRVEYNVLCTLTNQVAREPQRVWKNILELNLQYIQFTPCLDDYECPGGNAYALTPELYASFYKRIFSLWVKHFHKGQYRSIKLFDDLVNLIAFQTPTACGINGFCQPQMIVEADGSVYPCDFYCLDQYRLGSICEKTLLELYQASLQSPTKLPEDLPEICHVCEFAKLCNGGCRRMRDNVCFSRDKLYCGNQDFLKYSIRELCDIARQEAASRYSSPR